MKNDLQSLKEMLQDGVPGTKIAEALGISTQDASIYARAWGIKRKRGRPRSNHPEGKNEVVRPMRTEGIKRTV